MANDRRHLDRLRVEALDAYDRAHPERVPWLEEREREWEVFEASDGENALRPKETSYRVRSDG